MKISLGGDQHMIQHKHVTLLQVAEHAGVSRATASLAVRGSKKISDLTREKVLNSIKELGYIYDRVAANLRSKSSSTVGLIIMDLANPFYSEVLIGIHQELTKCGQTVILGTTFDSYDTQNRLLSTMLEHRVGGIILFAVPGSKSEALEQIQYWGIPVVLVGRKVPEANCDYVSVDNVVGGELAVDHLIQKGHRRIAFLGGPSQITSWQERKQGYDNAHRQAGITIDPSLIIEGPVSRESGVELIQEILRIPDPPTAVFCYNDVIALGAMMKLREMGMTPGRDIGVIGFDNIQETTLLSPNLTTVSSFPRFMGIQAATLLHKRMEGLSSEPQNIILQPKLIVRESC